MYRTCITKLGAQNQYKILEIFETVLLVKIDF